MNKRILEMEKVLKKGPMEVQPSKYWHKLNKEDMNDLENFGFNNFKRNIVKHYFTGISRNPLDFQIVFLLKNVKLTKILSFFVRSLLKPKHKLISLTESINFNLRTFLTWEYAKNNDRDNLLKLLKEPLVGNPPKLYKKGVLISMDIANSLMEYYSIKDYLDSNSKKIICEIGSGYGRNAFVFLSLSDNVKYIMADIPPALYVSERYISEVFPDKKIFRFREFDSYSTIKEEFELSDVCFILPNQLKYLPSDMVDLFINISSFHEMRIEQIKYYFKIIKRLLKIEGLLYLKQWKNAFIPFENVEIKLKDYPIDDDWNKIYIREAKIQTKFFEALLKLKKNNCQFIEAYRSIRLKID